MIVVGSIVLAAAVSVAAYVFLSRASSSAASKAAGDLASVRDQYHAAAGLLKSQTATFDALMAGAVQTGDVSELNSAAESLTYSLENFDATVTDLSFPASLSADEGTMFQADSTLLDVLSQPPTGAASVDEVTSWVSLVRSEYVAASAAHTTLASDLGVPADSFAGAPNPAV
jgi:hypothetical protein